MKRNNFQLHATPLETIKFINSIKNKFSLNIVIIYSNPFIIKELSELLISDIQCDNSQDLIYLSENTFDTNISSKDEFLDKNSGIIKVNIGEYNKTRLRETIWSFVSESESEYKLAKKIIYKLRKLTQTGGKVVNPNGKSYHYPDIKYTKGAKELYDKGIHMLAFGSGLLYHFDSWQA